MFGRLIQCLSLSAVAALLVPAGNAQEANPKLPVEPPLGAAERSHWSFQKPIRPPTPKLVDPGWVRTPVDAFVLAKLTAAGLRPAPPADRATLLRRVTFDLTGLPPTPAELEHFLSDSRPDAYARVVERLLASPHYGERWAQHWLDVVRYAESDGYEADGFRTDAWRYRDYVIRSLNEDKPYDQFLTEQLAGDELARGRDPKQSAALLIATGFSRCGPVHLVGGNTDPEVNRQEVLTETTTGLGAAFLGLTVQCARCHDHKFDPISQADYYRLQAFFAAAQPKEVDVSAADERAAYEARTAEFNRQVEPLKKQLAELEQPYHARLTEAKESRLEAKYREALAVQPSKRTPEQQKLAKDAEPLLKVTWDELVAALAPADRERRGVWRARIHDLEAHRLPPPAHAWAIQNADQVPPTHVLKRGDPKRKGAEVRPGFPRVLSAPEIQNPKSRIQKRADLARWLSRPDHPLTARVLVNRIWQHHFGNGLVRTPNDFGLRGEKPTHPELLDWLATEFTASGWSIKHMHRLIVLSSAYQQASRIGNSEQARRVDPDNRLLWRMNRRRLESEALRDQVLAVSDRLNRKGGGPMVRLPLEPEVYELIFTEAEPDGLWQVTPDEREHARRSIYLFAKRNVRMPLFEAFDQPDTLTSCPVRSISTFAPQALILMNGPFMQQQSKAFASRLLRECGADTDRLIDRSYRLALARPPFTAELDMARQFLNEQSELLRDRLRGRQRVGLLPDLPEGADPAAAAALADFCLALFNRNEFVYVR